MACENVWQLSHKGCLLEQKRIEGEPANHDSSSKWSLNCVCMSTMMMLLMSVCRGWEKMYALLTSDSLLFFKDQKHAKAVSVCRDF